MNRGTDNKIYRLNPDTLRYEVVEIGKKYSALLRSTNYCLEQYPPRKDCTALEKNAWLKYYGWDSYKNILPSYGMATDTESWFSTHAETQHWFQHKDIVLLRVKNSGRQYINHFHGQSPLPLSASREWWETCEYVKGYVVEKTNLAMFLLKEIEKYNEATDETKKILENAYKEDYVTKLSVSADCYYANRYYISIRSCKRGTFYSATEATFLAKDDVFLEIDNSIKKDFLKKEMEIL